MIAPADLDRAVAAFDRAQTEGKDKRTAIAEAVGAVVSPEDTRTPALLRVCADAVGVPVRKLVSPSRSKHLDRARRVVVWALRTSGMTWPQIGELLGHGDHTTALRLFRRADERADEREAGAFVLALVRKARVAA